ncbi:RNA polymerase factor sigma-54 [Roseicitreum antarcticum]|uniref:RNA polymerase sigma-54 factor n=1 Tax=Roseicitreum antarcticum TaxID=564137 RepID=A0A1H2X636_9RHOB|nr:RNA polymerase sigma-54 factor [Roseicitreum antarcticum]SDW88363.1 RNA polymerase, sigma 54 subunit, RpoN/SigL [Roseicitreum antarcticum]
MALKPSLNVSQSLGLALTPMMRQALQLLRFSAVEVSDLITHEAEVNPFLKLTLPRTPVGGAPLPADLAARGPSVLEDLAAQLRMMDLPGAVRQVAQYLAADLSDEGYLAQDTLDSMAAHGVSDTLLEAGIAALQRCTPAGVGARDLTECLTLQLCDAGLDAAAATQTVGALLVFAACAGNAAGQADLARRLNISTVEVARRVGLVRDLRPRPIDRAEATPTLHYADLKVARTPGAGFAVTLNREDLPEIEIDQVLAAQAVTDNFGRDSLARAQAILSALQYRGQTLQAIGGYLLEHQYRFFAHGPDHLRPMTRAAVAQALDVHPSTISRAVANKAIDCNGRIWPLSVFFSSALPSGDEQGISGFVVQRRIGTMIGQEDPLTPLSDDAITTALHAEGVDIARRTVAKYRQGMRIPASSMRRQRAKARPAPAGTRQKG